MMRLTMPAIAAALLLTACATAPPPAAPVIEPRACPAPLEYSAARLDAVADALDWVTANAPAAHATAIEDAARDCLALNDKTRATRRIIGD